MRALHLLKTSTGAKWAFLQIRELTNLGVEVHVALPDGGPMVGKYTSVGATEHLFDPSLPLQSPWELPNFLSKFNKLIYSIKPDIVHSHFVSTTLAMRLAMGKKHNIPRVFQVPGPLHLEHSFFRRLELVTSDDLDYWIGSCKWTCACYRNLGINKNKIYLSYYGTDLDVYKNSATGKLRKELGLNNNTKIIGMVAYMYAPKIYLGQNRGLKGHEDLIDALEICYKKTNDIICVIVGGAWNNAFSYENKLRSYARKKCGEKIVFLGTRNDVPSLYPEIDLAVHPSHSENLGGAAESLLCGIPTIGTNIGGLTDLIIDGKTGLLVSPGNSVKLANTILFALKNLSEMQVMAARGKMLAEGLLNIKTSAADILKIYKNILK